MTKTSAAAPARAGSAGEKTRASRRGGAAPPARNVRRENILAEHMAEGCPSAIEAARRMRITVTEAEGLWKRIVRALGRQAS